jgi:hypothetical protein
MPEQLINQGSFTVIYMGNDGNITNFILIHREMRNQRWANKKRLIQRGQQRLRRLGI